MPGWPEQWAGLSLAPYTTKTALGQLLAYAGLFFFAIHILRSRHAIRSVCWTIVGTASVMAIIGILQEASGTNLIYWFRDTSYAAGRFFGPYINRNHFAGYQAMAILLGLGLLLTQPVQARKAEPQLWRHRLLNWLGLLSPSRLLLMLALSVMTGAIIMSASRGGVLSLLLGLLCLALFLRQGQFRAHRRTVLGLSLVAMVGMGLWLGTTSLFQRFEQLTSESPRLLWAGRLPALQAAWEIVQDFPLTGIGYDAFPVVSARYQSVDEVNFRFAHVHNDFLQLLAETGWLGAGLLLGSTLLLMRAIMQKWQTRSDPFVRIIAAAGLAALVALGAHSLVDFNLHIPQCALVCDGLGLDVCLCASAAAWVPRARGRSEAARAPRSNCARGHFGLAHHGWARYESGAARGARSSLPAGTSLADESLGASGHAHGGAATLGAGDAMDAG